MANPLLEVVALVKEFHLAFGHPVAEDPELSGSAAWPLRLELIEEEIQEAKDADTQVDFLDALLDIMYVAAGAILSEGLQENLDKETLEIARYTPVEEEAFFNLLDIYLEELKSPCSADYRKSLLAYLVQICFWQGYLLGFKMELGFKEVHTSNMSKLGADGNPIYREDGKILKGPSYRPPELEAYV